MQTPGRPVSPTVHRRTRPEGEEVARKMRATHDWFRHDGKNVEQQPQPPHRLTNDTANEIAQKNKQDSEKWYGHDMTPTPMEPPKTNIIQTPKIKASDPAAKDNFKKVAGMEEPWYKFEDNQDYHTPRVQNRLQGVGSVENKMRNKGNPTSWYRHEHEGDEEETPSPQHTPRRPGPQVEKKSSDEWYCYEPMEQSPAKQPARFHNADAESYLQRGRQGSATSWYGHDSTPSHASQHAPRVTSIEGSECAAKGMSESGNWFSHDANQDYHEPTKSPRLTTDAAKEMYERSQGTMNTVLQHENTNGTSHGRVGNKVTGELAQEVAKKNVQGIMMKFLNEDVNREYSSPRPGARVRAEGEENYTKNKGDMGSCLGGYPEAPMKHSNRRVKPEAAENAAKNKGTLDLLMNNYGDLPQQNAARGRSVKPEAMEYAERNKGTLSNMFGDFDNLAVNG